MELAKLLLILNLSMLVLLTLNIVFVIINDKLLNECKRLTESCKEMLNIKGDL